jgi:hypothetical protein
MNRLPQLFLLQAEIEVLSRQTDVLPAVGGAEGQASCNTP